MALTAAPAPPPSHFRYFNSSPEGIRLAVLMYVKYSLSLRNVEDLLPLIPRLLRRSPKADTRISVRHQKS